jgi:predicted transcriptional regulator
MTKRDKSRPTDAELRILRVLWRRGPSTVKQVQEDLNKERPTGYTTVLKFMQIMTDKELVEREDSQRSHVYRAALAEEQTQGQLVRDLLERAFGGSAHKLVAQALSAKKASPGELARIRELLDQLDGGAK